MTPVPVIDYYLKVIAGLRDHRGRNLARALYSQPVYARNFLELGLEEIRSVPKFHDVRIGLLLSFVNCKCPLSQRSCLSSKIVGLNTIGQQCPISILYCGGPDQWAPHTHMNELKEGLVA